MMNSDWFQRCIKSRQAAFLFLDIKTQAQMMLDWILDDERSSDSSCDENNFRENEAHTHLSNDSDDSEGQLSRSFESNELNRDIDLNEGDQWCAYSVEKADPLCYKFDDFIRRGLIPKNGILYKYLTDVIEI